MIEVEHARLDPKALDRWRIALDRTPVITRRAKRIEPEILASFSALFVVAYLFTIGPHHAAVAASTIAVVRGVIVGAVVLCWIAAELSFRERTRTWRNGRFLYAWGWVEIHDDVLRAIPREELELTLRPAPWGLTGQMLYMRSGAWRRNVLVEPDEIAGLEQLIREPASSRFDLALDGYRDSPPRLEGSRTSKRSVRLLARAIPVIAAGCFGALVPGAQPTRASTSHDDAAVATPPVPHWNATLAAMHVSPAALSIDVSSCQQNFRNLAAITFGLSTALAGSDRSPIETFVYVQRPPAPRLVANCRWELGPSTGLFSHVVASWELEDEEDPYGRRSAVVTASDVIAVVEDCSRFDRELAISPRGLAGASLALVEAVVIGDVASIDPSRVRLASDPRMTCVRQRAATIRVHDGALTPPSGT